MIVSSGNHSKRPLEAPCNPKSPLDTNLNSDTAPPYCQPSDPSLRDTPPDFGWLQECQSKTGNGFDGTCDPMQTGQIAQTEQINRNVVYRYAKAYRGHDEAMLDLFRNLILLDEEGKSHPVPIIWATQERAVQVILSDVVRKDNSLVTDRIKLPIMALWQTGSELDRDRYIYHKALWYMPNAQGKPGFTTNEGGVDKSTVFGVARGIPVNINYTLYAWTAFAEDMNQIREQLITKFSPVAYIKVRGVWWEIIVEWSGESNNINTSPGNAQLRIIKYEFNFTVKSYIPQPIRKDKAVLGMDIDFYNSTDPREINEVLGRLRVAAEDFNV